MSLFLTSIVIKDDFNTFVLARYNQIKVQLIVQSQGR
nr:MAG TPA: hypothetical protein [Caudoviricetes sp.]